MVPGDENTNFYSVLCDVIELIYVFNYRVTLFQCNWYDNNPNQKRAVEHHHLTSINVNHKWYVDDSYILSIQAPQVFYMDDLVWGPQWKVVKKVQHRGIWDILEEDGNGDTVQEVFQKNESLDIVWTIQQEDLDTHVLVPHKQALEKELQGWTDWANEMVMQAAQRLGKDQGELKTLRFEYK
ncbi:Uncharacterized protein Adt_42490 [Abeliophyllum distichum]|uniref:DUF4216 domain-containing protein n=1 Tax=Abeliophyllum distichum TaxID=126358 RepID=A0ABD1PRS8_9LAMI